MNDEIDIEKYKNLLLQRQTELLSIAKAGSTGAQTVELDQSRVGRLSRMDAMQGQAMSVEANRRRALELTCISAALNRLETDDYGYCIECGESIAHKRLDVDPSATLCIQCANHLEQQ